MKVRKFFVSNSSSSSWVCDVCGREEIGMDLSLGDIGMVDCVNGHTFCEEEMLPCDGENEYGGSDENGDFSRYEASPKVCPICAFAIISEGDIWAYFQKQHKFNSEEVEQEIRAKFNNYEEFTKYLKDK